MPNFIFSGERQAHAPLEASGEDALGVWFKLGKIVANTAASSGCMMRFVGLLGHIFRVTPNSGCLLSCLNTTMNTVSSSISYRRWYGNLFIFARLNPQGS